MEIEFNRTFRKSRENDNNISSGSGTCHLQQINELTRVKKRKSIYSIIEFMKRLIFTITFLTTITKTALNLDQCWRKSILSNFISINRALIYPTRNASIPF